MCISFSTCSSPSDFVQKPKKVLAMSRAKPCDSVLPDNPTITTFERFLLQRGREPAVQLLAIQTNQTITVFDVFQCFSLISVRVVLASELPSCQRLFRISETWRTTQTCSRDGSPKLFWQALFRAWTLPAAKEPLGGELPTARKWVITSVISVD